MFGYNAPTLKEYIGIPSLIGLVALAIVRNFPSPEADVFLWAVEINVAIVPAVFLIRQFVEAEYDTAQDAAPQLISMQDDRPTQASNNIPRVTEGGNALYGQ